MLLKASGWGVILLLVSSAALAQKSEVTGTVTEAASKMEISASGDAQGRLVGTVSRDDGVNPVIGAEVVINGSTPLGGWARTTRSGENGLFVIELPLGSLGIIGITARAGESVAKARIDGGDIVRGLTPPPVGNRIALVGTWDFAPDPPRGFPVSKPLKWSKIAVPSHWEMEGFACRTGLAAYRRKLRIPKDWNGKRIKFRAEGIYSRAEVWLNGKRVGSHQGGATPFALDVTDAARPGLQNEIAILLTDRSDAGKLDSMSYYAHFNLGGIWRPLELFCVEPAHISRLAVTTDFDAAHENAELCLDVSVSNEQSAAENAELSIHLLDPDGREVKTQGLSAHVHLAPWEFKQLSLKAAVSSPQQWSAESPRLYRVVGQLKAGGRDAGTVEQALGFRTVEIEGRTFKVNGRPVKLWGACRHDADPLLGRAITPEIAERDIELMKDANLNAFRSSHYPPNPEALAAADRIGLYVEDEAPFCWAGVSFGPANSKENVSVEDLRLAPLAIGLTCELIERDRNHPSVVIWSQCNESAFGRIFRMANEYCRHTDPTRPWSAGQSANLDIATYHNPTSMQRMKDTADLNMPVLFDEGLAIFQGFGSQAYALELDPGLRDYWVTAYFEPLRAILASEHQFGAMIWAWVDDAFLMPGKGIEYGRRGFPQAHFGDGVYKLPGRGVVGDPLWGVIEGWRRVRPEWWLCKKLFSPIHIEEKPLALPKPGESIVVTVENRNVFTNLSRYACKWSLAGESGRVRTDVPPHGSGVIRIAPKHRPAAGDTLVLEFYDERHRLVDGYRLGFKPHEIPKLRWSGRPAMISEPPGNLNMAVPVILTGGGTELAFDRTSGALMRGTAGGELVLMSGPSLHVLKNDSPAEVSPAGWRFTDAESRIEKSRALLVWNGEYGKDYVGGFEIRMDDGGNTEIAYRFAYAGPEITTREVGIDLELPLAFDRLEWDRKAEWSYYPDDHIGRPHGTASAHPNVKQTAPPGKRPFALDDHPWGCNDFRSTKRNIYQASLTERSGAGMRIVSDGGQSVRATVGVNSISLKILDFYGGSATGWNEWDGAYGNGRAIKPGDVIEGTVRLRLLKSLRGRAGS